MLKLKCQKHPRYTGMISPRASCQPCITIHHIRLMAEGGRVTIVSAPPKETQSD